MKGIVLTSYTKITSKKYEVVLGNGALIIFQSERKALDFLRKTSKILTGIAYEFNLIDSDLYPLMRQSYFNSPIDLYEFQRKLDNYHLEFIQALDFALTRKTVNYQWFVFNYLNNVADSIINIIGLLEPRFKKSSETFVIHKLKSLKLRVLSNKSILNNYGLEVAQNIVKSFESQILKIVV